MPGMRRKLTFIKLKIFRIERRRSPSRLLTEILLKMALNTIKQTNLNIPGQLFFFQYSAVIARLPILGVTTKVQKNSYRCKLKTA